MGFIEGLLCYTAVVLDGVLNNSIIRPAVLQTLVSRVQSAALETLSFGRGQNTIENTVEMYKMSVFPTKTT